MCRSLGAADITHESLFEATLLWTRAFWLMMSMGFTPDSLNASDPAKSAFLEFGHGHPGLNQHQHQQQQQHQHQHPATGLSHIYPVHGLHASGHSQHESSFAHSASSYGRSLGYSYPGAGNAHPPSAYGPYQHSNPSNSNVHLAHSRSSEETGMYEKGQMPYKLFAV